MPEPEPAANERVILEEDQEFSRSRLWDWQRAYYDGKGVAAWREGQTPHYVTSNPRIARNYAEIVLALFRDLSRHGVLHGEEPIQILEIGAGSGRFAWHFLHWLRILCDAERLDWQKFRYILSDNVPANLAFWRQHPKLQGAFDAGVLDLVRVDVMKPGPLHLERTSQELCPGSLRNPLILIANYLFDSLPHHLLHFDGGSTYLGYVTLAGKTESPDGSVPGPLSSLEKSLRYRILAGPLFADPSRNQLIEHYQASLESSHVLFPAPALDALDYFRALSLSGMMVLTADKGAHLLSDIDHRPPPELVQHGEGFSVMVNYHVFAAHCRAAGGMALFPEEPHSSIDVGCLCYLPDASEYRETVRAYRQQIAEFGPDAFLSLSAEALLAPHSYSIRGILSHLQLSFYDSYVFERLLPRLLELAPETGKEEKKRLIEYLHRVWNTYYPIGEPFCPANQIACLLYELDEFDQALRYFEKSVEINGPNTGLLYNMALCCTAMDQHDLASKLFQEVVNHDPANESAREMLNACDLSKENPGSLQTGRL